MHSPHSSEGVQDNILEQALRTYEESERSLKSICNSVEHENCQLENQLKSLENHQSRLRKNYHSLKERVHQIRGEHARLAQKQILIDQQTQLIPQRYEQVQLALKKVLSFANPINEHLCEETFPILGLKFIPIDEAKLSTNITTKRKSHHLSNEDLYRKEHKNKSSFHQRSSK